MVEKRHAKRDATCHERGRVRQKRISVKAESRGVVVTKAGTYLRLIDSCVTQFKAQGPSRSCNESQTEEVTLPATRERGYEPSCEAHKETRGFEP